MKSGKYKMVSNREVVPENPVIKILDRHFICILYDGSMTYTSCKRSVTAVYAIYIDTAGTCRSQMLHTVVYGIEKPFPVKRATLEYDGYLKHGKHLI